MKNTYEAPTAEKIAFEYQKQVASSACTDEWTQTYDGCMDQSIVHNYD